MCTLGECGGVLPSVVLSRAAERHARYLPLRYHFITIILLLLSYYYLLRLYYYYVNIIVVLLLLLLCTFMKRNTVHYRRVERVSSASKRIKNCFVNTN